MRSKPYYIAALLALVFSGILTSAQGYNYSFEHYTTDQGLSHDEVACILKDHKGFMWFGTRNGLNRFDGYSFKVFLRNDSQRSTLPSNSITALTEDPSGLIWISTSKGLAYLNPDFGVIWQMELKAVSSDESFTDEVTNMALDKEGRGWCARGHHLYCVNLQTRACQAFPLPVSCRHSNSVYVDQKDRIWVILQGACYRFSPEKKCAVYYAGKDDQHSSASTVIMQVRQLKDGKVWMISWGNGLLYYDERKDFVVDFPDGNIIANCFTEGTDWRGRPLLWVGGHISGLAQYHFDEHRYHVFTRDLREPLSHNETRTFAIFNDSVNGIVWFGTENGIEKYDRKSIRFNRFLFPASFASSSNQQVSAIVEDHSSAEAKSYWIGIWASGIMYWNSKTNAYYNVNGRDGLKSPEVFDLVQDNRGYLWVGEAGGVQVYDPVRKRFTAFYHEFLKTPFVNHKILKLFRDHDDNIWMCANYEGLFEWQRSTGKIVKWVLPCEQTKDCKVLANRIGEDSLHRIWVTSAQGLFRIDPLKMTAEAVPLHRGIKYWDEHSLGALCVGRSGDIWVGGNGFVLQTDLQGNIRKVYSGEDGLRAGSVMNLAEDRDGYIWVASDNYLHRIHPMSHAINYFGKEDGLINNAQMDGFNLLGDGTLAIGYQRSFCMINCGDVPFNRKKTRVELSGLSVWGQERYPLNDGSIMIHPDETSVTLEFTLLNFTQPQKNVFAFKLDDTQSKWFIKNGRDYILSNLTGGDHVLYVKGCNNDGIWSDVMSFHFTVNPPFRQTWYFKLMVLGSVGVVLYLIYWYKEQSRSRVDGVRKQIAKDLHDDIGSTLSSIRILSQVVKRKVEIESPKNAGMLEKIENDAAVLMENMQDIVWTIQSQHHSVNDLLTRMKEYALRVLEARDISFHCQIAEEFKEHKLDAAQRRNLYLIFKEAINNAVKYSFCTRIQIYLSQKSGYLKMVIEDNGCGFDIGSIRKGNGLDNFEKRAKEIGGAVRVESKGGEGTRIDLIAKL